MLPANPTYFSMTMASTLLAKWSPLRINCGSNSGMSDKVILAVSDMRGLQRSSSLIVSCTFEMFGSKCSVFRFDIDVAFTFSILNLVECLYSAATFAALGLTGSRLFALTNMHRFILNYQ